MSKRSVFVVLFSAVVTFVLALFPTPAKASGRSGSHPKIQTDKGLVVGTLHGGAEAFLGIPYAAPPVGDLRWKPPQVASTWTGELDASSLPNICPQAGLPFGGTPNGAIMGKEDCLYLNVFRPTTVKRNDKLPVMVWIHGGAFVTGSANEYDGSLLAERHRVIVVTLNYRLGALGFLAHPELSKEAGNEGSGNYGILDQQMALKWTAANIAAFGGNPANVTIFGESAGGASVCSQLVSPKSAGLFHKAIIESGLCTYSTKNVSLAQAESAGIAIANQFRCNEPTVDSLACLRAQTAKDLVNAPAPGVGIMGNGSWGTNFGSPLLPLTEGEAFTSGQFNKVPVLNGSNTEEGRLFALFMSLKGVTITPPLYEFMVRQTFPDRADEVLGLYPLTAFTNPSYAFSSWLTDSTFSCPALKANELLSQYVPTFAYEFSDRQAPISLPARADLPELGAYHASEIVYIFQRQWPLADPARFTVDQRRLANQMQQYWINFAKSGTPNGPSLPDWPEFKTARDIQNLAPSGIARAADFSKAHHCDFWK